MSLVIYTKPGCPYCRAAMDHYDKEGIVYEDRDAQTHLEFQKEMLEYTDGDLTVPAIVENGVYIGSGWGDPPKG